MRQLKHLPIYIGVVVASFGYQAQAQKIAESVGNLTVEEIIVSARKTEESLQDIPFSIQAVTEDRMTRSDFRGLEDIAKSTPGFIFETFANGLTGNPTIRGQANTSTTARIQNTAVFINGIYLQRQSMLNTGLLDMQRVEVLKGPQSTLFGRNAFSGAVNYITAEPSDVFGGKVSVTMGDDERRDYKGSITGPIIEDKLEGSFSYGISEYDGHTKNNHPAAGVNVAGQGTQDNLGGWDDASMSIGLRFHPTDKLDIEADYYKTDMEKESQPFYSIRGVNTYGLDAGIGATPLRTSDLNCNVATMDGNGPQPGGNFTGNSLWCGNLPYTNPYEDGIQVDPRSYGLNADTDIVRLKAIYEFSDDWNAYYQYGYIDHSADSNGGQAGVQSIVGSPKLVNAVTGFGPPVFTYDNATIFNGAPNTNLRADSHEVRFEWAGNDQVAASFGLFYSKVEDEDWGSFNFSAPCSSPSDPDCYVPVIGGPTPLDAVLNNASPIVTGAQTRNNYVQHGRRGGLSQYEDDIRSIFGDITYNLTDDVSLRLEGRYSEEEKSVERITDTNGLRQGEVVVAGTAGTVVTGNVTRPRDSDTFYFFAPRASLEWQAAVDNMVYFTVGKGEKTGGFNNTNIAAQAVYDPEINWTYELGSKNSFMDQALQLNGSIYYTDWRDLQGTETPLVVTNPFAAAPTQNIGSADVYGIEFNGIYNLTENYSVDFGYTYLVPKYKGHTVFDAAIPNGLLNYACDGVTCPADGVVDDNQVARTSRQQGNIGLNYRTVIGNGWGLLARLDASYQSKQYVDPLNLGTTDARTITNTSITLQAPNNWEVTFWGKNILNEEYVSSAFTIGQFNQYVVTQGAGESYGVTATYSFE